MSNLEDLSMDKIKKQIDKLRKEYNKKQNKNTILLIIFGVLLISLIVSIAIFKLTSKKNGIDEFDEDFTDEYEDENGCVYTDEDDFE